MREWLKRIDESVVLLLLVAIGTASTSAARPNARLYMSSTGYTQLRYPLPNWGAIRAFVLRAISICRVG